MIKHTDFFSVEILLFWLPGRVAGPEVGPRRKWQGLGPALSVASAATANDNSPLLHYNSPSASDVSGLIYNDRVITAGKVCLVGCNRKEKNRKESQGVSFVEILMSRKSDSW